MKCKKVESNLLKQRVLVTDILPAFDCRTNYSESFYETLDTVSGVDEHGAYSRDVVRRVPYEITPESVKSYAGSVDYRVDPVRAVANGVTKQNLGDVREFQRILKMDDSAARAVYLDLKAKFESVSESASEPVSEPASEPVSESASGSASES